jgi:MFS family permease
VSSDVATLAAGEVPDPDAGVADLPATAAAEAGAGSSPGDEDESALGVLGNRDFLVLWLSQVATQVGGNAVLYCLGLLVLLVSNNSTTAVSVLFVSFLAPAVLFGAVAGVFVDRLDRRKVLVATSLLRGVLFLLVAFFNANVFVILSLNIVISVATTFFAPAELAMIPLVVRREQLTAANGIFTLTLNGAFAIGFTLLGPVLNKIVGAPVLIVFVACLYFVSAALCATLPAAPPTTMRHAGVHEAEAAMGSVVHQLREGFGYVRHHGDAAWALLYLSVAGSIVGILGVVGGKFAQVVLHLNRDDFVVVVLPLGFGVVFGALLVNAIRELIPRRRLIEAGLVVMGVCLFLITLAGPISDLLISLSQAQPVFDASSILSVVTVVIALATTAGVAYAAIAIPAQTELQEVLPTEVRGRVFGVLNTLVSVSSLLPIIVVGPLQDVVGVTPVMLVSAALVAAAGVASMIIRGRPVGTRSAIRSALGKVTFRPDTPAPTTLGAEPPPEGPAEPAEVRAEAQPAEPAEVPADVQPAEPAEGQAEEPAASAAEGE